jgi:hypothetical protein
VGDVDTGKLIAEVLDAERPDLVVFSGDQLNGQGTSWDSKSVVAKFGKEVIEREIAWTAIFGESVLGAVVVQLQECGRLRADHAVWLSVG